MMKEEKPNRITRLWAGLAAVAFVLMAFRFWIAGMTAFTLSLIVFVVGSVQSRRHRPPSTAQQPKEPFWKKFLFDLLATISLLGLGLCFIPILAISSGNLAYLPLVWIASVVAIPFALVVQWRLMNRTLDRFAITKTSFAILSVAVAFSTLYLLPNDIREDQDVFPWVIGGIALLACLAIPRVGMWLQGRFFPQKETEKES